MTCLWCGESVVRLNNRGPIPKYCNKQCKDKYGLSKRNSQNVQKCEHCGVEFNTAIKKQKYCSAECRCMSRRTVKGTQRICVVCGVEYEPTQRDQKCCGDVCAKPASHKTLREKRIGKACQSCGKEFTVDGAHEFAKYCSRRCRDFIWRHRRRAMEAGVWVENFPVMEIFDSNGWRCRICGKAVDKKLKYPHPKSASLDHILPLSKGGEHSRANVQLAHFMCNIKKGSKTIMADESGQLRIV